MTNDQVAATCNVTRCRFFTLPSPFKTFSGRGGGGGGGSYYSNSGGGGSSRSSGLRGAYWWCHPTLPIHPDVCSPLSIGHIYRISVCKLDSWSEVSHLSCQTVLLMVGLYQNVTSESRTGPHVTSTSISDDTSPKGLWRAKQLNGKMLGLLKVLNVVLEISWFDLIEAICYCNIVFTFYLESTTVWWSVEEESVRNSFFQSSKFLVSRRFMKLHSISCCLAGDVNKCSSSVKTKSSEDWN